MNHKLIYTFAIWLFAACFCNSSHANFPGLASPLVSRILAKTAVETVGHLLFEDLYEALMRQLTAAGPGAGLTDFSLHLNTHSDVRTKSIGGLFEHETRSIVNNPITGSLSYFRTMKVGYSTGTTPPILTYESTPFGFPVQNLSESCSDSAIGLKYRRTVSTSLLLRHSYTRTPWFPPPGYMVSIGMAHAPLPSMAPCDSGLASPPPGTSGVTTYVPAMGGTVIQLPSNIGPNAVGHLWIASAFPVPRGAVIY